MKKELTIKEAYQDILLVCEKYVDNQIFEAYAFDDIKQMVNKAKNHLEIIRWEEDYGLNFSHEKQVYNRRSFSINDSVNFIKFNDAKAEKESGSGYFISWSDDGRQPNNEWLLNLSYSTGAYFFGKDYPEAIFEKFWLELKNYKPDYCDTANKNLYFKLENARNIFNDYEDIVKKYREENKKDFQKRKIKKMEEELNKEKEKITQ